MTIRTADRPSTEVVVELEQMSDAVAVMAKLDSVTRRWILGYLKQDKSGRLFFERSHGISDLPGYPLVALELGGKMRVRDET